MKARQTLEKRRKEKLRQDRKRDKAERRAIRKQDRDERPAAEDSGEDPDIAGIVPGPQPLPEEFWGPQDLAAGSEEE